MAYYWKTMPIEERIAVRIRPNGECREWTGGMNGAFGALVRIERDISERTIHEDHDS